ncbi:uncharacterized protein LOC107219978 [Neodiprion lecontei]|uniref:Uncharacterized protein LOC107219978 n=1 Tax=Neodiprion lecontei TaxID=441921 RepID=A0A6J0BGA4_NEOLC|nr:uncharacterized protein LOC107219978 [Neodiprion lecontei]
MTPKWFFLTLVIGLSAAESPPYRPRGWRPSGQSFSPGKFGSYGPPVPPNTYGPQNETPTTTSTTTTTQAPTTTTPRSREPTTPFPEDDNFGNPAVAVANSFAFNRPVYVYNGFPYLSGYTVLK